MYSQLCKHLATITYTDTHRDYTDRKIDVGDTILFDDNKQKKQGVLRQLTPIIIVEVSSAKYKY